MTHSQVLLNPKSQIRKRRLDPFASPKKITQLLEKLIEKIKPKIVLYISLENIRENDYETLIHILQKGSNHLRLKKSSKITKNENIPISLLLEIINKMSDILAEESHNRISFRTFTDNYLRILNCPQDIKELLEKNQITLFEALQLKRLSAENLEITLEEAFGVRKNFFLTSRKEKWVLQRLRYEVDLKLNKKPIELPSTAQPSNINPIQTEEIFLANRELFISPNSFFTEQLYSMIEMINSTDLGNLEKKEQETLLNSIDNVILQLQKIIKRKEKNIKELKSVPNLGFL